MMLMLMIVSILMTMLMLMLMVTVGETEMEGWDGVPDSGAYLAEVALAAAPQAQWIAPESTQALVVST